MTKYYRNGTRTYYQVKDDDFVMQIINKATCSYVTVSDRGFLLESALEGQEITREEFKNQFDEASKLIILEP